MELEKEKNEQFDHAIEKGDLDLVRKLLEEGKSLCSWNANLWTPLYSAVAKQNVQLVRLFLEKGADVNLSNKCNLGTPLQCACEVGRCDLVKLLLERGAEVNSLTGPSKNCPLFLASERGHCDIVEVLLAYKAEVNLFNERNEIPLDVACQKGHLEVVKILLDNGANVNWSGMWEGTPLIYACEEDYYDIVKLLLDRGANLHPVGCDRPLHTPLYHAALRGYSKVSQLLLLRGADVNWPNVNGDTPLHGACYNGDVFMVELLLNLGAEINRLSIDGKSPLFLACASGNKHIIQILLERGADVDDNIVDALDLSWEPPLYMALREGHREMISMLLNTDLDLFYPIHKDNPLGKTICEVRNLFYFTQIWRTKVLKPLNLTKKVYINEILKEHLTKLMVAGLADTVLVEEEIVVECVEEVLQINSFYIYEDVTLSIVFEKVKCPLYLRNRELLIALKDYLYSPLSQCEFPIYASILKNTLNKSMRKLSMMTSASKVLQYWQPQIPILVVDNVLKYLDEAALRNLSSLE